MVEEKRIEMNYDESLLSELNKLRDELKEGKQSMQRPLEKMAKPGQSAPARPARAPVRSGSTRPARPPGCSASVRPEIGLFVNSAAQNSFSQSDWLIPSTA